MKHKLLNKLLTLALLTLGGVINPAWGADEVYKTALFGSSYNANNSSYTSSFTATNGSFVVTVTNFNNNNNGWTNSSGNGQIKCGRKGNASVATITTNTSIDKAITKVNITIDDLTTSKINSITLYTSTNGSSWTSVGTYTKATGTQSVSLGSPIANLYYKLEFDCASGSSNGLLTLSQVDYYVASAPTYALNITEPTGGTITVLDENGDEVSSGAEFEENAELTISAEASTGYTFSTWTKTAGTFSEDATTADNTFTMPAEAATIGATFTKNSYSLSLTNTNGVLAVTVDGADWDGSSKIPYNSEVEITATPNDGYLFGEWTSTDIGDYDEVTNPLTFNMPASDVEIDASFVDAASYYSITVDDDVTGGTISADKVSAAEGATITLTATPSTGYTFTSWTVKDASDNTIMVTDNKFTMPASNVTVTATFTAIPVTGVTLNKASTSISVGETETLTATVAPADALNKAVTWTSSNTSVATVSDDGVVTAVAAGSATITVTTTDGSFTATCIVTVFDLSVGGSYVAVTEDEDLVAGDKYIIVYNGNTAMSTTQNTNNRGKTTVTLTNGVITLSNTSTVAAVMLGGTSGAWTLQTLAGYLQSPSTSNYLTCSETVTNNNQKWTITTADAKTTIRNNGHTSYYLQYNTSSSIFSCYTNTQKDVQLYHKIVLEDAELSFASSTAIATYGSIFSGPVLTNENSAPLTWTSSNETVATVNSSGEVTLLKAGETTITATATGRYTGEASYTLTVNRAVTSLAFAASNPSIYVGDDTYTQTATITPVGADNTISYAFVGEHGAATINSSTGTVTFNSYEGELTIEASAAQTDRYAAPSTQSYILTVVGNKIASIALSSTSGSTIYGANVTIDATFADEDYLDVDGAGVTATGFNSSVATYSFNASTKKITITPVAVGTTTFTFQANEVTGYDEGSTVNFTITVNAPVGLTKSALDFDFTTNDWGLPTDYDNSASEKSYTHSTSGYTIKLYGPTTKGFRFGGDYLIMGQSGAYVTLPAFDKAVTRIDVVGKSGASASVKQNIFVGETAVSTETTGATETNVYEIAAGYQAAGNIYTLKVTSSHNTQITKIVVHFAVPTITAKINASGYATFCSEYPLDFTDAESDGYSAWQITDVSGETITFSQITGSVKGGTGILLKGTAGETITLTSANSTNELSDNKLVGTLAPTYVAADTYYGLKGSSFVPVNAGTVPAGKALLPVSGGGVKAFTFIFEDDADGISEIENGKLKVQEEEAIYNLAGQRISRMQKGINIVNGKKVLY